MNYSFGIIGIIGFTVGAVLAYWLQKRNLGNAKQRLQRAEAALAQTEALNRQQTTQLQKFREAQTKNQNREHYYQGRLQELEQSYKAQLQELEQHQTPNLEWGAARKIEIERLQAEQEAQLQQKIRELEASYQSRIAELGQVNQLQPGELLQSRGPSQEPIVAAPSPAPLEEEAWKKTEAYWSEPEESGPASFLINPFVGETLEKQQESWDITASELDLAALLDSEGDNVTLKDLDRWQNQSQQLEETRQEESVGSDLDLFETLDIESSAAAKLPEIANDNNEAGDILPDLFSDSESSEDDLQEFLAMLQSEGEPEHQNQNGQASKDVSITTFS